MTDISSVIAQVSVPYEITLLSNGAYVCKYITKVSVPYEITLLSNITIDADNRALFQYLMKLHYSQTTSSSALAICVFQYLMKLHYSQTIQDELELS